MPDMLLAQAKVKASVPFSYQLNPDEDQYNQRIRNHTLAIPGAEAFVALVRTGESKYSVQRFTHSLQQTWSSDLNLVAGETVDAFTVNTESALVVTHLKQGQQQVLQAYTINLANGKAGQPAQLLQAPSKGRKANVATSADGTKILVYRFHTDNSFQIHSISGQLYSGSLQPLQDVEYTLNDLRGILTADIQLGNNGAQYLSLISDQMNRLSVRQYLLEKPNEAKVMSVLVGGVFDGQRVYIRDTRFKLMPNGLLYGAVLTATEEDGAYYSLKTVKYDFAQEDMVFAEEFRFTPEYVAQVNLLDKESKMQKLQDIYLTDLFLTPEKKLVLLAEKKYTEGGENAPFIARELHLFAYDEYMNNAWQSLLMKRQQAPASEGFTAISYSPYLSGTTLQLLTLETIRDRRDLYLRHINTSNGQASTAQAVGIQVAAKGQLAHVKSFTHWLSGKEFVTVARTAKQPEQLQLLLLQLK